MRLKESQCVLLHSVDDLKVGDLVTRFGFKGRVFGSIFEVIYTYPEVRMIDIKEKNVIVNPFRKRLTNGVIAKGKDVDIRWYVYKRCMFNA